MIRAYSIHMADRLAAADRTRSCGTEPSDVGSKMDLKIIVNNLDGRVATGFQNPSFHFTV